MHPLHNRRYNRSHHEGQSLYVATLLSVLAGLLTLYVLLRLYPKPPAPTPVPSTLAPTNHTTWEWKTSSGDSLSGSDIDDDTTTQAPQGTVYNPPPRRHRSITPSDDPDAPQRNNSDPCLPKFDGVQITHINGTKPNLTRDAVEGISTQLAATSLMAFQNRVALDMLLAEKGGVCAMFGEQCCTFIPNNTAPDGSVTKALNGLRALSTEMKEASGMDNPFEAWMRGMFGKWKALAMAIFTSIACFLAILITCGCCCIPCARTLCNRLITAALSQENAARHYEHQMIAILARAMPPAGAEDNQSSDYGDEEPYGVY